MSRKLIKNKLPQRAASHKTDTKALRLILGQLNEDWVIRNLEERDYGIDLQLELFDDDSPTGNMVLVQVKGTEDSFKKKPSAKIPISTLHYAELFRIPFFLFRVSLADKETEFIWLQKYIDTDLSILNPKWRSNEKDLSIRIPRENKLGTNEGKFRSIVLAQNYHDHGLSFIKNAEALRRFLDDALNQKSSSSNASYCLEYVRELAELMDFLAVEKRGGPKIKSYWESSLKNVDEILRELLENPQSFEYSQNYRKSVEDFLHALDQTMHSYLTEDDTYRSFVAANQKTKGKVKVQPPF